MLVCISVCKFVLYNGQQVTHQIRIKQSYCQKTKTLVISKNLTNVTLVYHAQEVRHQTQNKNKCTRKSININDHQRNEPVEHWDRMKFHQINKHPNKGSRTKSLKRIYDVIITLQSNKHRIQIVFTMHLFLSTYQIV